MGLAVGGRMGGGVMARDAVTVSLHPHQRLHVPTLLPEGGTLDVRTHLGSVPPSGRWFNPKFFYRQRCRAKAVATLTVERKDAK
jgi:hypothetical protein